MDFALENVRLTGRMENVDIVGCLKSPRWQELRFICGKSLVFQGQKAQGPSSFRDVPFAVSFVKIIGLPKEVLGKR